MKRREFLKTSAQAGVTLGAGLLVGFEFTASKAQAAGTLAKLNGYVHISSDDTITLLIGKGEMGQGTVTSLSQILAEELDAEWAKFRTEFTPVDAKLYGPMQGVFGSLSIRTMYVPLRQAGAQAREMLVAAAAQKWGVNAASLKTEKGFVINPANNQRASYGSLAVEAGKLTPPAQPKLKETSQFQLIGKSLKRLDTPSKVNGTAKFGIDTRVDGLVYAAIAKCPVFGGKVKSLDAAKAKAIPGVKDVVEVSSGVAVIAEDTWTAMEARKALEIVWDEGKLANLSSEEITQTFADSMAKNGAVARKVGDAAGVMAQVDKKMEVVYQAPYLSHAPMEPMNATAQVKDGKCEVWVGSQMQTGTRDVAVEVAGVKPENVITHFEFMGGGFGRRGGEDFVRDAVEVATKTKGVPVKVTWSREDDMQHDQYRPASYTRFQAVVGEDGLPLAITSRVACAPFGPVRDGVAGTAVEGIQDMQYSVPNFLVDYHMIDPGIPVTYWRSVGYSQNCFFMEAFIDELAAAAKIDPLEYRLSLLGGLRAARMRAALNLAADKFGWKKPLLAGHGKGIGIVNNIGSFTAVIAEASVQNNKVKVHRVVAAVDCGQTVNPALIDQQIQSGIVYGLASAMKGEITIEKGRVKQSNFHNYDVTRMDEMPVIETYVVPSTENPGGIGEASTPPVVPALANAIFSATGKRVRKLPIRIAELA